ncbi:ankyrin repeat domain-containing protein [Armatimonas sp.]|uniref:ankyrin repeat domain-containing protein n=1 Tax=Armatimonas sp. TaxID=1872638 RepID=UPI00286CF6B3|nr:ankyrin repeat domain-containing protein [Armatimonas sp.]
MICLLVLFFVFPLTSPRPIVAFQKAPDSDLFLAAKMHHWEMVAALLNRGANPNTRDKKGWTVLMLAARESHKSLRLLLDKGAKVNARTDDGWTALMCAVAEAMPMQ